MPRPKSLEPLTTCTIKVPIPLYTEFMAACQHHDATASVVLRQAMREFLRTHPAPGTTLPSATPVTPAPDVEEDI